MSEQIWMVGWNGLQESCVREDSLHSHSQPEVEGDQSTGVELGLQGERWDLSRAYSHKTIIYTCYLLVQNKG